MDRIRITKGEFAQRAEKMLVLMEKAGMDAIFVYGDEYRKENLRYASNFWPLFERGAAIFTREADPIVLCAPEGQKVCEEMSVWGDIRVVPDFLLCNGTRGDRLSVCKLH